MVGDEEVLLFSSPLPLWVAEGYHDFFQHFGAFTLLRLLFGMLLVGDIVK
jgi:hypothetical protein